MPIWSYFELLLSYLDKTAHAQDLLPIGKDTDINKNVSPSEPKRLTFFVHASIPVMQKKISCVRSFVQIVGKMSKIFLLKIIVAKNLQKQPFFFENQ